MPNSYFQFKQFTVHQEQCAMKVTTDACLFGAWVAEAAGRQLTSTGKLLDVGTGTGLLSLMIAQKAAAMIEAIEIDSSAAKQARENIAASPWRERISIVEGDVLRCQFTTKYKCIVSNPPFYENSLKSDKRTKNMAHHDEGLTLGALLSFINRQLTEDGSFFLLLPAQREREFAKAISNAGFFLERKVLVSQSDGHPPFRLVVHCSRKRTNELISEELSIKGQDGNYTAAFTALLKDYYLHL